MTGKIARILKDKGFGFLKSNSIEYFFHLSGCITNFQELNEGDEVEFEIEQSTKGPSAYKIRMIE